MSLKIDDIVESLKSITLLEAVELVKKILSFYYRIIHFLFYRFLILIICSFM